MIGASHRRSKPGEVVKEPLSPYYPPRARWYSPLLNAGDAIRRLVCLDQIQLPRGISARDLVCGLVVPGLAFYVRGEKLIGRAVMCGCALLAASFIVWLGYPLANVAFGLLLSAHVTSILFLFGPELGQVRLALRAVFGLALLSLAGLCVYAPLRNQLQAHCLMPLRQSSRVVVVQRFSSPKSVRRGDWIAYEIPAGAASGIYVGDGFGLGPVLAVGGDRIRFTPQGFEVNGIIRKSLAHMPAAGEMVVPEKHWFLWPELAISGGHGNPGEMAVAATMLQLATVSEAQFAGKPLKWWFWRRQILV